jgi:hypothetical protein
MVFPIIPRISASGTASEKKYWNSHVKKKLARANEHISYFIEIISYIFKTVFISYKTIISLFHMIRVVNNTKISN